MTEIILTCCDYCNPECNEHPQCWQLVEMVDCLHYEPLTCAHCGHQGQDVTRQSKHIGGFPSPLEIIACQNEVACWQRWERNQQAQIRR